MAEAAFLRLPYPEAAVVEEASLAEQSLALAADLPERPLVLGGCCCAHVGAVEELAARPGVLAVVWIDAHGDLNTPQSSPSGNAWGMPLRMLLDGGAVEPNASRSSGPQPRSRKSSSSQQAASTGADCGRARARGRRVGLRGARRRFGRAGRSRRVHAGA